MNRNGLVRKARFFFLAAAFLVLVTAAAFASGPPVPDYMPYCQNPQDIAPMQPGGASNVAGRPAVAWNGQDYGVAWIGVGGDYRLHFRRFYADGTPAAAPVTVSTLFAVNSGLSSASLIWNGSGYAVTFEADNPFSGFAQVYFALLKTDGTLKGGPGSEVKVSYYGNNSEPCLANEASLAWNGSGYAVSFTANTEILATLLDASGAVTYDDLAICTAAQTRGSSTIAWSPNGAEYLLFWEDSRSAEHWEIWGAYLSASGSHSAFSAATVTVGGDSYTPSITAAAGILGLVWSDTRDGDNGEIYFAPLDFLGAKLPAQSSSSDVRLTNDSGGSGWPRIIWNGAEFGVFWYDDRTLESGDVWFQRVSASGVAQGSNAQVTWGASGYCSDAAFGKYGYLVTNGGNYSDYIQAWGCNYAYQPPCPENLVAYNVTGSTATISWLPVIDNSTDIAYYLIYRNNALVGQTSDTFFADSGLSLGTTYEYAVRTVNAAQYTSTGCGTSATIYVKSNATLTLMLNKNTPDAQLSWSDITLNNYNVFRGTTPQVMQQIGSTSGQSFDDPNVLTNNVLYFYTVDEPGQ